MNRIHVQRMWQDRSGFNLPLISHFFDATVDVLVGSGYEGSHSHLFRTLTRKFSDRISIAENRARLLAKGATETKSESVESQTRYALPDVIFDPFTVDDVFGNGLMNEAENRDTGAFRGPPGSGRSTKEKYCEGQPVRRVANSLIAEPLHDRVRGEQQSRDVEML